MQQLEGKTAFITGGASGIGLGIARACLRASMKVVIADLRQDHLDAAAAGLSREGFGAALHVLRVDVTDREAMARAAEETERVFTRLHLLVNNAGVGVEGPIRGATFNDWDFGFGVNLGGVVNGLQLFVPRIRAHGEGGHVVNTASLAALVWMPSNLAIYAASKAAVISLSESLRDDLARDRIGISVLCPGPVRSNIHESGRNRPEQFRGSSGFREAEQRLALREASPLWMDPDRVGELVLDGIRNDRLYVITHGEWREAFDARVNAIRAAMPTDVDPRLIASMRPPESRQVGEKAP